MLDLIQLRIIVFIDKTIDPKILNDYKIVDTVGAGDCFTSAFCSQFYRLLSEIGEVRESTLRNLDNDK